MPIGSGSTRFPGKVRAVCCAISERGIPRAEKLMPRAQSRRETFLLAARTDGREFRERVVIHESTQLHAERVQLAASLAVPGLCVCGGGGIASRGFDRAPDRKSAASSESYWRCLALRSNSSSLGAHHAGKLGESHRVFFAHRVFSVPSPRSNRIPLM